MEVIAHADHEAMSRAAAERILDRLRSQPNLLLCAASGNTPTRTYQWLSQHYRQNPGLFAELRLIKLDEWGGLPMDDPATCEVHLQTTLVEPLGIADRYVSFQSDAPPQAECARIAFWLRDHGPIDLCVLGLGLNGHLGFNEPAAALQPHAHVAKLSATSLSHAMLGQSERSPAYGITLGMADLLQAREILLVVSGTAKSNPLSRLMDAEITTDFPASLLWLHPCVKLYCDLAART